MLCAGDTIVTQLKTYQGIITGANKKAIMIDTGDEKVAVAKAQIKSCMFATSDIITLRNNRTIVCKVIVIANGIVGYVTDKEAAKVKATSILGIDRDRGPELLVKSLPFTSTGFIPGNIKQSRILFLALGVSTIYSNLKEWREQFTSDTGKHPNQIGYSFSGEIGIASDNRLFYSIGCKYYFKPTIQIKDFIVDETVLYNTRYLFPFGGIKVRLMNKNSFFYYAKVEAGWLQSQEKVDAGDNGKKSYKRDTMAGKIIVGVSFQIMKSSKVNLEAGYFLAKIKAEDKEGSSIPLDFSGPVLSCGITL
jgi:mRNA-degrading endonuclease HigB of HigAB toxin-antitoxin module